CRCRSSQAATHPNGRDNDETCSECTDDPTKHVRCCEVAERVCHTATVTPGGPEGRQYSSGCQRCRSGSGRSEYDDASEIFTKSRLHADVCQPIGPRDEEPQSADSRDCCSHQRHRCDCCRSNTLQEESGDHSPQRQCHQEDKGDGREGVYGIMQHLSE